MFNFTKLSLLVNIMKFLLKLLFLSRIHICDPLSENQLVCIIQISAIEYTLSRNMYRVGPQFLKPEQQW